MIVKKNGLGKFILTWLLVFLLVSCGDSKNTDLQVCELKCQRQVEPMGIDVTRPKLSWNINSLHPDVTQKAYRILVASDTAILSQDKGDIWDSGEIKSSSSIEISYSGGTLKSETAYYWKVKVWAEGWKKSAWSSVSKWEMGLIAPADWKGRWIDDGKKMSTKEEELYEDDPSPLFRKSFYIDKDIKSARLYISGAGYYESFLNGSKIGDHELDPAWTDYSDRVYYSTFDVTSSLSKGDNSIGVMLGNGWFNPLPLRMWGHQNIRSVLAHGRPTFICQLRVEAEDGTVQYIVSDDTWKVEQGPIIRNNIYLGEVYDANKEIEGWNEASFSDKEWGHAFYSDAKLGQLQAQPLSPIRATVEIKPIALLEPENNVYIYDMGQNFAGWAKFKFTAPKGTKITMRYGELLTTEGDLNPMTSACGQIKSGNGGPGSPEIAWQEDIYIAKGEKDEEYLPSFTFHGFRYVEITGLNESPELDDCVGFLLNSDVDRVGEFSCSDTLLNRIQKMCEWTFLSNIFSVQSDCPHRERFSYGADIAVSNEAFMYNFDMSNFYIKAVNDLRDGRVDDIRFTDTSPFVGIDYCGIAWAMAHPLLQLNLYQYYGNKDLVVEHYPVARKWFEQFIAEHPDHFVAVGLHDHESLVASPNEMMITPLYYYTANVMEQLATILELETDVEKYKALKLQISDAYTAKFFDKKTGKVGDGNQGSQSFALYTEIIPREWHYKIVEYMVNDIVVNRDNHLSTGIYGTQFMLDKLSEYGYHDLAMKIVTQETFPSWGHMLANGATTLWEHWEFSDNTFSHNHPMFGSVSQWFYQWLGGIQPDKSAVGFDEILICPQIEGDVTWVKCNYKSSYGPIVSNWTKNNDELTMQIEIPANTTARIVFPGSIVEYNETQLQNNSSISDYSVIDGDASCKIGSGKYTFKVKIQHLQI